MECLDKREIKIYRWLDKLRDDWDVHNECVPYTHIAYFENHITIQLILQSYELHIFTLCRLQELFNNNNKKYSIIRYTLICSMNNFWKVTFHILNIVLTCVTNTQWVCTTYTGKMYTVHTKMLVLSILLLSTRCCLLTWNVQWFDVHILPMHF